MYYDVHTHKIPEKNGDIFAVVNLSLEKTLPLPPPKGDRRNYSASKFEVSYPPLEEAGGGLRYSIGLHPWHIKKENVQKELDLIEKYISFPDAKILGECGLDKLCETDFELQKEAFSSQILISEKANKPLLIHCVKSFDEIIAFKKKYSPKQAWIIHGFRGKAQQAKQLTDNGFFLSFGFNYNEESIKNIPIKRVLFETDDSNYHIRTIYKKAAGTLGISEERLINEVEKNVGYLMIA